MKITNGHGYALFSNFCYGLKVMLSLFTAFVPFTKKSRSNGVASAILTMIFPHVDFRGNPRPARGLA